MCNKKVMRVTVGKEKKDKVNWLSCCFGGYGAMDSANKKMGRKVDLRRRVFSGAFS